MLEVTHANFFGYTEAFERNEVPAVFLEILFEPALTLEAFAAHPRRRIAVRVAHFISTVIALNFCDFGHIKVCEEPSQTDSHAFLTLSEHRRQ